MAGIINEHVYDGYPVCADVYVPLIHAHECACDIRFEVFYSHYENGCDGYHHDYADDYVRRLRVGEDVHVFHGEE